MFARRFRTVFAAGAFLNAMIIALPAVSAEGTASAESPAEVKQAQAAPATAPTPAATPVAAAPSVPVPAAKPAPRAASRPVATKMRSFSSPVSSARRAHRPYRVAARSHYRGFGGHCLSLGCPGYVVLGLN